MGHQRDLPFVESAPGMDALDDSRFRDESRELPALDGRAEARDADRARVSSDAANPGEVPAQEVPTGAECLVTWDVSPDDAGHRVEETEAEDEADVPAAMAEKGRDDADHDLRHANRANTD